jgi:hypothetical protein
MHLYQMGRFHTTSVLVLKAILFQHIFYVHGGKFLAGKVAEELMMELGDINLGVLQSMTLPPEKLGPLCGGPVWKEQVHLSEVCRL